MLNRSTREYLGSPGVRTTISHPETKTMTHYLRHHHDGILVGSGTVLADNPGLNCKWGPDPAANSPRPIIIDTKQKWRFDGSKMQELLLNDRVSRQSLLSQVSPL